MHDRLLKDGFILRLYQTGGGHTFSRSNAGAYLFLIQRRTHYATARLGDF